jgi:hypothetical protein
MFLKVAHPSSDAFPAGTMIVLRLRATDASETCSRLNGLKGLSYLAINSKAVFLKDLSHPKSISH